MIPSKHNQNNLLFPISNIALPNNMRATNISAYAQEMHDVDHFNTKMLLCVSRKINRKKEKNPGKFDFAVSQCRMFVCRHQMRMMRESEQLGLKQIDKQPLPQFIRTQIVLDSNDGEKILQN